MPTNKEGMGKRWMYAGVMLGLLLGGCASSVSEPEPTAHRDISVQDDFTGWPEDTIERGSGIALVERNTEEIANDPEPNRIPCFYSVPDWAEPAGPINYQCTKGGTFVFHLLKADPGQRAEDLAQWERLANGEKLGASVMVVARPWRGWYGEAAVGEGKSEKRTRIYTLFSSQLSLQMQIEWPLDQPEARQECEQLVQAFVYSVQAAPGSG